MKKMYDQKNGTKFHIFRPKKMLAKKNNYEIFVGRICHQKKVFLVENLEFGSIPVALCGDLEKNDHTIF